MLHAGTAEGPEWDAPMHRTVQLGRGAEATAISSEGGQGGHRQGFQRLWATPGDGELLHIPGTGDIGGRQILTGGGKELVPGKGGLEEDDTNPHQGGGGAVGVQLLFKGRGAGGAALRIRYLSDHPLYGKGPGEGFSPRWRDG